MAYTPTEWECGDTITAEKLNKMEQGIADCGGDSEDKFIIYSVNGSFNKTKQEIIDALNANKDVYYAFPGSGGPDNAAVELLPVTKMVRYRNEDDFPIGNVVDGSAVEFGAITDLGGSIRLRIIILNLLDMSITQTTKLMD